MQLVEEAIIPLAVLSLALLHALGEMMYKKGGMMTLERVGRVRKAGFWIKLLTTPLVILSLLIAAAVKVLYGIILASNPLFVTGGIYLSAVALFSVLGGKFIFSEEISSKQAMGFVMIGFGILFLA
ncbi:MAG: hypothetical protein ACFFCP_03285 [Promethearchaeota archaeon]